MQTADHLPQQQDLHGRPNPQRQQFSLRTLIIWVLIFGILLGVVVRFYLVLQTQKQHSKVQVFAFQIALAASAYKAICHEFPTIPPSGHVTVSFLKVLDSAVSIEVEPSSVRDNEVIDAWGNPLRVRAESGKLWFWSCGPNGIDEHGTGDDINALTGNVIQ